MTDSPHSEWTAEEVLQGIGASTGIAIAPSWRQELVAPEIPQRTIAPEELEDEQKRLESALEASTEQLEALRSSVQQSLGEKNAAILDFHLMMLSDVDLLDTIHDSLTRTLCNAEQAVWLAIRQTADSMAAQDDTYFQERAADILDVGRRILHNLMGTVEQEAKPDFKDPVILLLEDLSPTDAAHLDPRQVAGLIIQKGSRTSHAAILARAQGIPAVLAVQTKLDDIPNGTQIVLDGTQGIAYIAPSAPTLDHYLCLEERQRLLLAQLASESHQPTETVDGYQACLVANVELPSEALSVKQRYNVGIGLFRTEFLFIDQGRLLSEDEQFEAYRDTAQSVYPLSVIFRTLDIGGDKFISQLQLPHELNPFMGTRAIRFSLRRPDIFKTQLRAILRASAYGKVRIMFPLISTLEELMTARDYLTEVMDELRRDNIPFNENLDVGCMIEVPAAALLAERLIQHVDFFSIGTNDLIQYSLAVDRSMPDIAYLYQPAHPAVIRQIKYVADTAFANGKWVSVCGEMAGDPLYTPLLLGMGIQELSMSPVSLARVHKAIRSIRMRDAEQLVARALTCNDGREVEAHCRTLLEKACPDIL